MMGQSSCMSPETYEKVFQTVPAYNALYARNGAADAAEVSRILDNTSGIENVKTSKAAYDEAMNIASALNLIALLMIVMAGIMAGFILLNIVNMQITQKKKELTIMRINGFTVREVIAYIAREAVVTNIIGIIVGVGIGMLLGYHILRLIGGKTSFFVHEPLPMTIILSVLITAGFSIVLNAVALKKVKYLKLTDI
ncbi:MAG: FtsX-like permease family protein [Lachnospiraceae bacterium]|nr:FtsX-like permease family protein [Lachnospiraceae bacterium]